MSVPDDLHRDIGRALRAEARAADDLDVDAVWSRVETGIGRRHRRR